MQSKVPLCAQGDLTDPLYFDFISFAQYSTVGTIIPKGQQVFKVRLALSLSCDCICPPCPAQPCLALPCLDSWHGFFDMTLKLCPHLPIHIENCCCPDLKACSHISSCITLCLWHLTCILSAIHKCDLNSSDSCDLDKPCACQASTQRSIQECMFQMLFKYAQLWVLCTPNMCDNCSMSAQEFCEDCPDQSKTVRRDATFKDNSALPAQVALRTGDFIYDGLRNGFRVSDSH